MTTDDQVMRDFTKHLFSDPEQPADATSTEPRTPNHVPSEGVSREPKGDPVRDFTRQLFGNND